ncbi:MAG: thioesterase family protein [Parvibaculales bacterium]
MQNTSFSNLVERLTVGGKVNDLELPESWLQGRTAYGGISTALMVAAIQQENPDAPPLRSLQVTFVGPLSGTLSFSQRLLRQGKNSRIIDGEIAADDGIGLKGTFIFSNERHVTNALPRVVRSDLVKPEDGMAILREGKVPMFIRNFDCVWGGGTPPFSADAESEPGFAIWFRHADPASRDGLLPFLAIADGPPPAMMTRYQMRTPLSSMNWHINFHTTDLITKDGWWLVECSADFANQGYSSQTMRIFNYDGEQVCDMTQYIAIFEPKPDNGAEEHLAEISKSRAARSGEDL